VNWARFQIIFAIKCTSFSRASLLCNYLLIKARFPTQGIIDTGFSKCGQSRFYDRRFMLPNTIVVLVDVHMELYEYQTLHWSRSSVMAYSHVIKSSSGLPVLFLSGTRRSTPTNDRSCRKLTQEQLGRERERDLATVLIFTFIAIALYRIPAVPEMHPTHTISESIRNTRSRYFSIAFN
jgi:hypothetical protein